MLLLLLLLLAPAAQSLPVVPNFQQGTLKSTTTTKTKVNEVINSYQYRTGYELSVSGSNVNQTVVLRLWALRQQPTR